MPKVRVATFNCENLFARFNFDRSTNASAAIQDGWLVNDTYFTLNDRDGKRITGNAIEATNADIIALQEVERMETLKRFRSKHIDRGTKTYPHIALIDGNDPRLIDVAVLSKHPITRIRTHQHRKKSERSRSYIFSRDCLEVDVEVGGKTLTLFVQHYKSMLGGRDNTKERRELQVAETRKIVEERFGKRGTGNHPWIVLGDFNDYMDSKTSLTKLVKWNQVEDVIGRLPADESWTHYWAKKKEYRQIDYLLLSKSLASASTGNPEIIRKGMPRRAERYTGPRFRGVGDNHPKASDHCPIVMEVTL